MSSTSDRYLGNSSFSYDDCTCLSWCPYTFRSSYVTWHSGGDRAARQRIRRLHFVCQVHLYWVKIFHHHNSLLAKIKIARSTHSNMTTLPVLLRTPPSLVTPNVTLLLIHSLCSSCRSTSHQVLLKPVCLLG